MRWVGQIFSNFLAKRPTFPKSEDKYLKKGGVSMEIILIIEIIKGLLGIIAYGLMIWHYIQ